MAIVGRLKSGVTLAQASAEMSAIARQRLNQAYPNDRAEHNSRASAYRIDGRWDEAAPSSSGSAIALAIAGLILLIACANVTNLLLARCVSSQRDWCASHLAPVARLIRQLLTESLLLFQFLAVVWAFCSRIG